MIIKIKGDALKPVFLPFFSPQKPHKATQRTSYKNTNSFLLKQFSLKSGGKQEWVDKYRRKYIVASDFRKNQQTPLLKHEGHALRCKIQMPCDNNGNRMLVLRTETPWDLTSVNQNDGTNKEPCRLYLQEEVFLAESESRDLAL